MSIKNIAPPKTGKLRITCPHCGQAARIRHSRLLSDVYRDGIIECQNILECGWRGRFGFEFLATLTPSAAPNPEINLPQSEYVLPTSPHALPVKLRKQTINPEEIARRNQLHLFEQ